MIPNASGSGFTPVSALARSVLMDHVRQSRYRGELPHADGSAEEINPLCGDHVRIFVKRSADGLTIQHLRFIGSGCIISQAAASLLCERGERAALHDLMTMDRAAMEDLLGATLSPSRVKCAMLPLLGLKRALAS